MIKLEAANDNTPSGRKPRVRPNPLDDEWSAGRISTEDRMAAEWIAEIFEKAHGGQLQAIDYSSLAANDNEGPHDRLRGPEVAANYRRILDRIEDACAHLWWAVLHGAAMRATMREIGMHYGAVNTNGRATENAPAIGREKLVDGLKLAARERARIYKEAHQNAERFGLG